ncbi:MAG: aminodeoxychorismate lyase [Thiotrichales bacterium]
MTSALQPFVLVNGDAQAEFDLSDRGLHYGDGLFETVRVDGGRPRFLEAHLARLRSGCERLGIRCPDEAVLKAEVATALTGSPARAVVKLLVTRGVGSRGYNPAACADPTRIVLRYPWPAYPDVFRRDGVALRLCRMRLGLNPQLAGLKHLNRLEQVLARGEWRDEFQEGLLLDASGLIAEGTMSNVFFLRGDRLCTPRLTACGVHGILRAEVLREAVALGLEIDEGDFTVEDLMRSDGIFLTNVVIGIWPVRVFEGQRWPPPPLCVQLMSRLGLDT